MIIASIASALGGLVLYLYFWQKGQFEEEEITKYQLFREDNPDN